MAITSISSKDRLSFALFLAISLHAALILGIGFSSERNTAENLSIDVTLSVANDVIAPEQADFIAATNQIGSGSEAEIMEMTTTENADFFSNEFQTVMSQATPVPEVTTMSQDLLTTTATAPEKANSDLAELTELLEAAPTNQLDREKSRGAYRTRPAGARKNAAYQAPQQCDHAFCLGSRLSQYVATEVRAYRSQQLPGWWA